LPKGLNLGSITQKVSKTIIRKIKKLKKIVTAFEKFGVYCKEKKNQQFNAGPARPFGYLGSKSFFYLKQGKIYIF
jgi:hypothetical protein